MTIAKGRTMKALDYDLPDVVVEYGNQVGSISATTVTPLNPTVSAQISNPHPTASMTCLVYYGAWMSVPSADTDLRMEIQITRSAGALGLPYAAYGVGSGGPVGWGEIPFTATASINSYLASFTCSLAPSPLAYFFTLGTYITVLSTPATLEYPTIRVIPLYFTGT